MTRRQIYIEMMVAWCIVIGGGSIFRLLSNFVPFIQTNLSLFTAVLLIYIPVGVHMIRKERIRYMDWSLKDMGVSFMLYLVAAGCIFPLFLLANHFWQAFLGKSFVGFTTSLPVTLIFFQIFVIALPEEFFFRGYLLSRLNALFGQPWKIFGVECGPGLLWCSLIFALSHSVIAFQWWHIFIFFPALVFGWLRERRGTITASLLFHATSNVLVAVIGNIYQ